FNNTGLVTVLNGTLQFPDGFTSSSTFNANPGAAINLIGGTFTFNPGHNFAGTGYYGVPSGTPFIHGPITNSYFQLSGGTMTISNQLTGTMLWSGGNLVGALTVKTNGTLNILASAAKGMTASITNSGHIIWATNGPSSLSMQSATIENQVGGVFDWQGDGLFNLVNSSVIFDNFGTIRKSAGSGTSGFPGGIAVNNVG